MMTIFDSQTETYDFNYTYSFCENWLLKSDEYFPNDFNDIRRGEVKRLC